MKNENNNQLQQLLEYIKCTAERAVAAASVKRLQVQFPNSVIHLAFSIDDQRQKKKGKKNEKKTLKEANLKIASLHWKR